MLNCLLDPIHVEKQTSPVTSYLPQYDKLENFKKFWKAQMIGMLQVKLIKSSIF